MFCTGKVGEALGEALVKTRKRQKECHSQKIKISQGSVLTEYNSYSSKIWQLWFSGKIHRCHR